MAPSRPWPYSFLTPGTGQTARKTRRFGLILSGGAGRLVTLFTDLLDALHRVAKPSQEIYSADRSLAADHTTLGHFSAVMSGPGVEESAGGCYYATALVTMYTWCGLADLAAGLDRGARFRSASGVVT